MLKNNFYVYGYLNPLTCEPFYIGVSGDRQRMYDHVNEAPRTKKPTLKHRTINEILSTGNTPIIYKIQENLTRQQAYALEVLLINKIGRVLSKDGSLVNISKGGELGLSGYKFSEESKLKMRERNLGKTIPDDVKKKMSKAHSGVLKSDGHKQNIRKGKQYKYIVTDNNGNQFIVDGFNDFCIQYKLSRTTLFKYIGKGKVPPIKRKSDYLLTEERINSTGWEINYAETNNINTTNHNTNNSNTITGSK
jgi:hypothetical protein